MQSTNQKVLITGGTQGIGQALAQGFASKGYDVIAVGLAPEAKTDCHADAISNRHIDYRTVDVRSSQQINQLIASLDRLDIVINAAGVIRREAELDPDIFAQVVDINLNGAMRVCAAAKHLLAKSEGCILNIASMLSYFGGALVPGYAASKGGIVQLTKSLAIAYAQDNIRVNALAPGWIDTALTHDLQQDQYRSKTILERTPMKRWGKPQDLIGPALFLTSDDASFITGAVLNVDGGYSVV